METQLALSQRWPTLSPWSEDTKAALSNIGDVMECLIGACRGSESILFRYMGLKGGEVPIALRQIVGVMQAIQMLDACIERRIAYYSEEALPSTLAENLGQLGILSRGFVCRWLRETTAFGKAKLVYRLFLQTQTL